MTKENVNINEEANINDNDNIKDPIIIDSLAMLNRIVFNMKDIVYIDQGTNISKNAIEKAKGNTLALPTDMRIKENIKLTELFEFIFKNQFIKYQSNLRKHWETTVKMERGTMFVPVTESLSRKRTMRIEVQHKDVLANIMAGKLSKEQLAMLKEALK